MKNNLGLMLLIVLTGLLLTFGKTAYSQVQNGTLTPTTGDNTKEHFMMNKHEIRVRFSFNGQQAIAILADNPTTRSMLAQLPITVSFEDFARTEKIAYFPNKLFSKDAPKGYEPSAGDITCYGPWGNLALFYKARDYSNGLIYMGKFESGFAELVQQGSDFKVTIEVIE